MCLAAAHVSSPSEVSSGHMNSVARRGLQRLRPVTNPSNSFVQFQLAVFVNLIFVCVCVLAKTRWPVDFDKEREWEPELWRTRVVPPRDTMSACDELSYTQNGDKTNTQKQSSTI